MDFIENVHRSDSFLQCLSSDEDSVIFSEDEFFSESDDEEPHVGNLTWKRHPYSSKEFQFVSPCSNRPIGPPREIFEQFIDDSMIDLIVEQSNLYSIQTTFTPLNATKDEIYQIIGIYLYMGLIKAENFRMYWESFTWNDTIASAMTRSRFQKIVSSLHFVDNQLAPEETKIDKFWKIRPWTNLFSKNLLKVKSEEYSSIDEMMIPFRGRYSGVKQYMKGKPNPWGIKVWCRCSMDGFLQDFILYQGKNDQNKCSKLGLGADVVLKLSESLPQNENYKVYADNCFSGIPLLLELKKRGILYTGTIRSNRFGKLKMKSDKILKKEVFKYDYFIEEKQNLCILRKEVVQ